MVKRSGDRKDSKQSVANHQPPNLTKSNNAFTMLKGFIDDLLLHSKVYRKFN